MPSRGADSQGNYASNPVTLPEANINLPEITVHRCDLDPDERELQRKVLNATADALVPGEDAEPGEQEGGGEKLEEGSITEEEGWRGEENTPKEEEDIPGEEEEDIPGEEKEEEEKEEDIPEEGKEDDELSLERAQICGRVALKLKKNKFFAGNFKERIRFSKNQPPKKIVTRTKKVENYVESLSIEELDKRRSVTPLFDHEESLKTEDFLQKRKEMLKNSPHKVFSEGEEIIVIEDERLWLHSHPKEGTVSLRSSLQLSGVQLESLSTPDQPSPPKSEETKPPPLALDEIAMDSRVKGSNKDVLITPEGYEEYLDGEIEEDYPELRSATGSIKSEERLYISEEQPMTNENLSAVLKATVLSNQNEIEVEVYSETNMNLNLSSDSCEKGTGLKSSEQEITAEDDTQKKNFEVEPINKRYDPLSGSSSMSFMDETTPTSVDSNYDFYQRTTKAAFKAESMCNKCISEKNKLCDISGVMTRLSLDSSDSSLNSVEGANLPPLKNSSFNVAFNYRKSSSASVDNDTMTFSNNSSNSSMSTSSNSVASEHSTIKPRSMLFIPTTTSSLPEILLEPPTPLAPKPKENYDPDQNVVYDLKVPGYKSMFLTVPGLDDYEEDRYLPGTTYETKSDHSSCSTSSSDDELVHKPRVFASLLGMAERRGLKSYGSSNDLSKFGLSSPEEQEQEEGRNLNQNEDDEINGNVRCSANVSPYRLKLSKIGGTKNGRFVATKLAMFEQVAEEEKRKYLECQEARLRISGKIFKHTGEYITRFYQPPNPDVLRVQENEFLGVDKSRDNNNAYQEYYRPPSPYMFRKDNSNIVSTQDRQDFDNSSEREEVKLTFKHQLSTDSTISLKRKEEEVGKIYYNLVSLTFLIL